MTATTEPATAPADLLTPDQRAGLAAVFADAITYRQEPADCTDCEQQGLCADHEDDLEQASSYTDLARELGINLEDS